MQNRRDFLKTAVLGSLGVGRSVRAVASLSRRSGFFTVHPFVENHPEAVFIMPTHVGDKMDEPAKRAAGLDFGRSVFVPSDDGGIPTSMSIPVKMNLKTTGAGKFPLEQIIGTVADFHFAEGVFEAMKEVGIPAGRIHLRENPRGDSFEVYGIVDMARRTGIDFRTDFTGTVGDGMVPGRDFFWHDVPDGRWFKRLPQLEPINRPGTWLLNIAKFKAHGMGVTLCSKNLQGMAVRPFCRFCSPADSDMGVPDHIRGDAVGFVRSEYERHLRENRIPRWDRPGPRGGIWQEVWTHRTLDNLSITPCGLNIIEGIYGRDGDAGNRGPHPPARNGGPSVTAGDFMHNMIIFGKNIFRTDIIGHWLAGHEPGNFGYFHIAIERGMSDALDPRKIPVYLWENGSAVLTPLESFKRTPLLTYYLRRDYGGGTEPEFHLVDEPFDYGMVSGIAEAPRPEKPEVFVVYMNRRGDSGSYASIEYRLPVRGRVRLEIADARGGTVDVLVDGRRESGAHMAVWRTTKHPSGTYVCRLRAGGFETSTRLTI